LETAGESRSFPTGGKLLVVWHENWLLNRPQVRSNYKWIIAF